MNHPLSGLLTVSLALTCVASDAVVAQTDAQEPVGIVYFIGSVDRVTRGSAVLDLGDAHTLDRPTLGHERIVAVFRPQNSYFRPVGTLQIADTLASYSTTEKSREFQPEAGDLVMFVRELSELMTGPDHSWHVMSTQAVRLRHRNSVATPGRLAAVQGLQNYDRGQPKWVRELSPTDGQLSVVGRLYSTALSDGAGEPLNPLVNQIDLLRVLQREGTQAVAAAGPEWSSVMPVLLGSTVRSEAESRKQVVEEGRESLSGPEFVRRVRRLANDVLFDRPQEQRNIVAALIAARMKLTRGGDDIWFQTRLPETQFPELSSDDAIAEDIRRMLRELRTE